MSVDWSQYTTGSVGPISLSQASRKLRLNWSVMTGSNVTIGPDRTGQLCRDGLCRVGGTNEVYVVRETEIDDQGGIHTLVNENGDVHWVPESHFWPWGTWEKLA